AAGQGAGPVGQFLVLQAAQVVLDGADGLGAFLAAGDGGQPGQFAGGLVLAAKGAQGLGALAVPARGQCLRQAVAARAEQGQGLLRLAVGIGEAGGEQVVQQEVAPFQAAAVRLRPGLARGRLVAGQQLLVGGVQPQALALAAARGLGIGGVGAGGLVVAAFPGQAVGGGGGRCRRAGSGGLGRDLDAGAAGEQQDQQQGTRSRHWAGSVERSG